MGSIPGQGTRRGYGLSPYQSTNESGSQSQVRVRMRGNQSMFPSHINVSLPASPSLTLKNWQVGLLQTKTIQQRKSTKWKSNLLNGRKYLEIIYLIMCKYPKHIRISYNSAEKKPDLKKLAKDLKRHLF